MDRTGKKTVIVIVGPTAVGKTAIAFDIANQFQTEIISADSRQCYRELSIGVARPSAEILNKIPHHFIASHSLTEKVNAALFMEYALEKTREIFLDHDVVVMVGGTGLYIKAFCEGLDDIPSIDPVIHQAVILKYEQNGLEWMQEEIRKKDHEFYKRGEIQNPHRLMRALEVVEATGESILSFHSGDKRQRDFDIIKIGLELPREDLIANIDRRVDEMMAAGLLEEVRSLYNFRELNAMQTVGYKEIFDHIEGKTSLPKAISLIKQSTRQYAKRQMTWFKKDKEIQWFAPMNMEEIMTYLESCFSPNQG